MVSDDDAPEPAGPIDPDELRAKDVVAQAAVDAARAAPSASELAELEAWFKKPSAAEIEERLQDAAADIAGEGESFDEALDREYAERQKRIAAASAAITPESIALLERHRDRASFLRQLEPPAPIIDESILRVRVPSEDEIATIGEGRAYERDQEVEDALAEAAPQAVLRDLFRPVEEFELLLRPPPVDPDEEPPVTDAHAAVVEALAWRPERPVWDRFADAARDARERFAQGAGGFWGESAPAAAAIARKNRESS